MDTVPAWYPGLILLLEDDEHPLDREQIRIAVKAAIDYVHTHRAQIQPLQLRLDAKEAELDEALALVKGVREANVDLTRAYANVRAERDALQEQIWARDPLL